MSKLKLIPVWGWAAAILLLAALVFRFALRGYSYIAYTLTFIAALIIVKHLASEEARQKFRVTLPAVDDLKGLIKKAK